MHDGERTPPWSAPYRVMMALRLLRARKINIISILGVMLGVASIIVVLSVMDGFQRELRQMIRGSLSDLIVEVDPARLPAYAEVKQAVEAVDGVAAVTLQKHTFAVIPTRYMESDGATQRYLPVRVVGIVVDDERRVSGVLDYVKEAPGQPAGDPFDLRTEGWIPDETPRILVSRGIARRLVGRLPLEPGTSITLVNFEQVEADGGVHYRTNEREVVVSRIFSSGNSEFDNQHIFVDLEATGDVFFPSQDGIVAELRVRLDDYERQDEARAAVARVIGQWDPEVALAPEYSVRTWEERQQPLLRAVNNEKFLLAFVLFFIVVVACFSVFATLTMTVVEKTREIGVLRALGATPGGILSIFMLNGAFVGIFGAGLGYGLGIYVGNRVNPIRVFLRDTFGWDIFPSNIYLFDEIPTYVDHEAAAWFAVSAAICALVFAIVPAVRAARLRPVRALRYE